MKFINLLKKELRELVNLQMIIGLVVTVAMLVSVGYIMSNVVEKENAKGGEVNISDLDKTDFTAGLIEQMRTSGFKITLHDKNGDDKPKLLDEINKNDLIVIPQGFTESIGKNDEVKIDVINRIDSASIMGSMNNISVRAVDFIQSYAKNYIMTQNGMTDEEIALIETPVAVNEITVVDDKSENISSALLTAFISNQGSLVPIVVFLLVMFTSQMIISAISTEKIDKTLETLLSAPVSRVSVLTAKMLAAAIVALINAAVYMAGFYAYMSSMMSGMLNGSTISTALTFDEVLANLGLKIGIGGYVLVGLQVFLTIMICLAVSLILGALVNDAKSAQTMLMPIMVLAMIPYLVSMVYDVNMLPALPRFLVYAIPFTHTFSAVDNVMFGRMDTFWLGIGYQAVLFIVFMFFALRLFMSDKIFTISLNLMQKKKLKKSKMNER